MAAHDPTAIHRATLRYRGAVDRVLAARHSTLGDLSDALDTLEAAAIVLAEHERAAREEPSTLGYNAECHRTAILATVAAHARGEGTDPIVRAERTRPAGAAKIVAFVPAVSK